MPDSSSTAKTWIFRAVAVAVVVLVATTYSAWWPIVNSLADNAVSKSKTLAGTQQLDHHPVDDDHAPKGATGVADPHAGHDHAVDPHAGHDHGAHADIASLELSRQAMRNLGLNDETLQPIRLKTFRRAITIPAKIVDRPGQTHLQVSAPLTGVVTRVAAIEGESLLPGDLIFEMRLTHEDLVRSQTDYLKTLGELDVETKEVARLSDVTSSGAVARRVLLERQYEKDKLEAVLSAQREALLLHGLSNGQVDSIAKERRLLRKVQVFVPTPGSEAMDSFQLAREPMQHVAFIEEEPIQPLTLETLLVQAGQSVETGAPMCVLADLSALYVEAFAFEQDAAALTAALSNGGGVTAVFDSANGESELVEGLSIRFLDTQIDPETRTLSAYVELPNRIVRDTSAPDGTRFVAWQYRPGQRLQVRVPVKRMANRIVLPVDAVAREGAENFVFVRKGGHFDRVPVHVEYRDQLTVVIALDGSVVPGDVVARRGAHQMQMALKNKSGGAVDSHAGHNH